MDYYDSGKMKGCAQDILAELKVYSAAKKEVDEIIERLKNSWKDTTNTAFSNKYNQEAKMAAENVEKLMISFSNLLEGSGEGFDKLQDIAQQGLR